MGIMGVIGLIGPSLQPLNLLLLSLESCRLVSPPVSPLPPIRLVAGLGNPGERYRQTRHNLGFLVLDHLAQAEGWAWNTEKKWKAEVAKSPDGSLWLVKPQTFMNLSGESIGPIARFLRLPQESVLAVVDDMELSWGKFRLRASGSAGGHNGLRSLIQHLGGQNFPRLRIGVGRPLDARDPSDHVLGKFSPDEQAGLAKVLERATFCILAVQRQGLEVAMNAFNQDPGASPRPPKAGGPPQASPSPPQKENPASP
jgi:peptidyl-tRNA hydrolase, PTH1 family